MATVIVCNKCGKACDVNIVDDLCVNDAGALMGYQPTHGESACCRAGYTITEEVDE